MEQLTTTTIPTPTQTTYIPYTGIGSRKTPEFICGKMKLIAQHLQEKGYTLRSGGAEGADVGFEQGTTKREIYIPWNGFNQSSSRLVGAGPKALEMASKIHPAWSRLTDPIKKLMGRNCYQVLGMLLDNPSKFVICWTEDGVESSNNVTINTGGTGFAIRLATEYKVPVVNLKNGMDAWIKLGQLTGDNWFKLLNV